MDSKRYNGLVLAFLWSIAILYILVIDLKGVWTDEGMRLILLSGGKTWQEFNQSGSFGSFADVVHVLGPAAYQPLFYVVDNAVIRIARSDSDVLLRLLNVLWLMLSLQGLLRLFRCYDLWTRLFAVVIFALNGYMIMHVMQIREYPMYVTFMIWSSCMLFELLGAEEPLLLGRLWPKVLAYGILVALLFYSHPYSIFALAAQVIMVVATKENRRRIPLIAVSYSTAAVLAAPWLFRVLGHSSQKTGFGTWDGRQPTFSLLITSMRDGFRDLLTYHGWSGHPLMQILVIILVLGIPAAWITARLRGEAADQKAIYALLTMVLFACFQITYFFAKEPLSIWGRYFIAYYYGYVVLTTCAFAVLRRIADQRGGRTWRIVAGAVFLFFSSAGLAEYRMYRADPFMDTGMTSDCNWRVTSRAMLRYVRPEETVVYYHPLLAWTMSIYCPFYTNELSYEDIIAGRFTGKATLWLLDTGVYADERKQALERLRFAKYIITRTADLGCQCKLTRLELNGTAGTSEGSAEAPPANATIVNAVAMVAGNTILDHDSFGKGLPVVRSEKLPSWAEFVIAVPTAGRYELRVRCASEAPRPIRALLNNEPLTDSFCAASTGGYMPASQRWQTAGVYEFPKGQVRLRLESSSPFPHISTIALVRWERKK